MSSDVHLTGLDGRKLKLPGNLNSFAFHVTVENNLHGRPQGNFFTHDNKPPTGILADGFLRPLQAQNRKNMAVWLQPASGLLNALTYIDKRHKGEKQLVVFCLPITHPLLDPDNEDFVFFGNPGGNKTKWLSGSMLIKKPIPVEDCVIFKLPMGAMGVEGHDVVNLLRTNESTLLVRTLEQMIKLRQVT
jgi:hypothetical protein